MSVDRYQRKILDGSVRKSDCSDLVLALGSLSFSAERQNLGKPAGAFLKVHEVKRPSKEEGSDNKTALIFVISIRHSFSLPYFFSAR